MATMTKRDLIDKVVQRTGLKRPDVKAVLQEFLDQIIVELRRGNRLEFRDFGVFEIRERAARMAQNPKTMEKVTVPAKRAVRFKIGRLMRESLSIKSGGKGSSAKAAGAAAVAAGTGSSVTEVKPIAPASTTKKKRSTKSTTSK